MTKKLNEIRIDAAKQHLSTNMPINEIAKTVGHDEKIVSAEEMLNALESNWEGYKDLHSMIMKKGKFFGNDYEPSDVVARRVTTATNEFANKRNARL